MEEEIAFQHSKRELLQKRVWKEGGGVEGGRVGEWESGRRRWEEGRGGGEARRKKNYPPTAQLDCELYNAYPVLQMGGQFNFLHLLVLLDLQHLVHLNLLFVHMKERIRGRRRWGGRSKYF